MSNPDYIDWSKIKEGLVTCTCDEKFRGKVAIKYEKHPGYGTPQPIKYVDRVCPNCDGTTWRNFVSDKEQVV